MQTTNQQLAQYVKAAAAQDAGIRKAAAHMGEHGLVGSAVADTAGRAMTALQPAQWIAAGTSSFKNPRNNVDEHEDAMNTLSQARPNELSDTELRLGAPNLLQDMVWKSERDGEDLPWTQQIGGRIMQNKRTGPVGKAVGYATAPVRHLLASLMRMPHYDSLSDTAHNTYNNRAITEHVLGHAINYNSANGGKAPKTMLGRAVAGTKRDLYGLLGILPIGGAYQAVRANQESDSALMDALPKDQYLDRAEDRRGTLPGIAGGQILGSLGGLDPKYQALGAMYGRVVGRNPVYNKLRRESQGKQWDKRHAPPKDGDKDGKVNDGTKDEKDVEKQAGLYETPAEYGERMAASTRLKKAGVMDAAVSGLGAGLGAGAGYAFNAGPLGGALGGAAGGGVAGAGLGAGAGLLSAAFSDRDEEGNKPWLRRALQGAGVGGVAGAGLGGTVGAGIGALGKLVRTMAPGAKWVPPSQRVPEVQELPAIPTGYDDSRMDEYFRQLKEKKKPGAATPNAPTDRTTGRMSPAVNGFIQNLLQGSGQKQAAAGNVVGQPQFATTQLFRLLTAASTHRKQAGAV